MPIYSTVAYNFADSAQAASRFALEEFGPIYSRITNPTVEVLEKRLAVLDGGRAALCFASGMAAINAALLTITRAGQNFLSATSLYGGTWTAFTQTFKKLGIEVRFFDPDDFSAAAGLIDEQTRCIYLESIGNPKGDIPDFEKIAALAHSFGLPLIVDNTVTMPALFRPLEHGADIVGRNAILHDPEFHGGRYLEHDTRPYSGLAIARMIGHITYLTRESMQEKFEASRNSPRSMLTSFESEYAVGSYLGYQGDKFVDRFDANSYLVLSRAMDRFDLGDRLEAIASSLRASHCDWLVISFSSDWLFPPDQSRALVNALIAEKREVSYCNVESSCGHDAFLLPQDLAVCGELIRGFLDSRAESGDPGRVQPLSQQPAGPGSPSRRTETSNRLDTRRIMELIPAGKSVLDLGCGHGELLDSLRRQGYGPVMGVELDEQALVSCLQRGVPVIQADLNRQLPQFPDKGFDVVVLSQTLQAILDVEGLITEIIRVGRRAIVSCPNFAYYKLRDMLYHQGLAPESPGILRHHWYNTPNLRFFSLADFEALCRAKNFRIHKRIALDMEAGREAEGDPNLNADLAIYVINGG